MKKNLWILLFLSCLVFQKCTTVETNDTEKVAIVLDANENEVEKDIETIKVANLPVKFGSIPMLMHPIGNFSKEESKGSYVLKFSRKSSNNIISNFYGDVLAGTMTNILFQNVNSEKLNQLTEKFLLIKKVEFLRDLFNTTGKTILIYTILDTDSNEDKTINELDKPSLYMSEANGTSFRKITQAHQELVEYKFLKSNNSLYFKTLEIKEKDYLFHYFKHDLSKEQSKVVEYFPIK